MHFFLYMGVRIIRVYIVCNILVCCMYSLRLDIVARVDGLCLHVLERAGSCAGTRSLLKSSMMYFFCRDCHI